MLPSAGVTGDISSDEYLFSDMPVSQDVWFVWKFSPKILRPLGGGGRAECRRSGASTKILQLHWQQNFGSECFSLLSLRILEDASEEMGLAVDLLSDAEHNWL